MIILFTDFGLGGPYLGQVKAVLARLAPGKTVIDLFSDAPSCRPQESAYLLAAYAEEFPPGSVFLAVVDPGVGGARPPVAVLIDGRWFVGPGNGLFEPLLRRGHQVEGFRLIPSPTARLSASFHGRDLFAPAAARLALAGRAAAGMEPFSLPRFQEWPDDLSRVVYIDHFGNALTGLRANCLAPGTLLEIGGERLSRLRTFGDAPPGGAFWYENANGLAEIAVNMGNASQALKISIGDIVGISTT
jgi:hypothetical protein